MKNFINLEEYFELDGLTYRVVPIRIRKRETESDFGSVNTAVMFMYVMNKFDWGNMNNSKVYLDEK